MIIDKTKNGKCSGCGECCTDFIPLTVNEVINIRKYIKKHNIKAAKAEDEKHIYAKCPFRDDVNKKCNIYEVRPSICRKFICNQDEQTMFINKVDAHKKAKYNSFNPEDKVSLYTLFYNDYEHELKIYYIMHGKDFYLPSYIKKVLSCL